MQPESRLLKEVKTEIEDVTLDIIQGGTGEALSPPCTTVDQGTDLSNQPTCNIDVNFLQQVVVAFEEVKGNQEESTRSTKVSISMNPSLEPTFLAITKSTGILQRILLWSQRHAYFCSRSDWLRIRLDEIKDAINYIVDTKKINDEMNMLAEQNEKKNLKSMKVELEKLKSEIQRRESQLNLEMLVTEELSNMINNRAFRIQQFQNMPLMEAFP
ncbi:hypothetical protein RND71_016745 [Anisodus tanguticus]|uniref:Uncharacterized protein n=1 Tax=Anisodus tanguticus TaxID=243964 RepID=A0AAE1S9G7_9SOLA|nr:hypothetical protein RND71_016745 [Anisodus tanguticus]